MPPDFYHIDLVAFLYSCFHAADTDGDASLSVEELRVALRDNPGFLKLVAGSDNNPPSAGSRRHPLQSPLAPTF